MLRRPDVAATAADRTSVRYQAARPDDSVLRERLKALAQERRRFGYSRWYDHPEAAGSFGQKEEVTV